MYGKSKLEIWENWANFEWGQTGKKSKCRAFATRAKNKARDHPNWFLVFFYFRVK